MKPLRLFHWMVPLFLGFPPLGAVEIVAYRGASHDIPENTMAAFMLGWYQRADACELDIWLSKDGQVVVLHDSTTKRTARREDLFATKQTQKAVLDAYETNFRRTRILLRYPAGSSDPVHTTPRPGRARQTKEKSFAHLSDIDAHRNLRSFALSRSRF